MVSIYRGELYTDLVWQKQEFNFVDWDAFAEDCQTKHSILMTIDAALERGSERLFKYCADNASTTEEVERMDTDQIEGCQSQLSQSTEEYINIFSKINFMELFRRKMYLLSTHYKPILRDLIALDRIDTAFKVLCHQSAASALTRDFKHSTIHIGGNKSVLRIFLDADMSNICIWTMREKLRSGSNGTDLTPIDEVCTQLYEKLLDGSVFHLLVISGEIPLMEKYLNELYLYEYSSIYSMLTSLNIFGLNCFDTCELSCSLNEMKKYLLVFARSLDLSFTYDYSEHTCMIRDPLVLSFMGLQFNNPLIKFYNMFFQPSCEDCNCPAIRNNIMKQYFYDVDGGFFFNLYEQILHYKGGEVKITRSGLCRLDGRSDKLPTIAFLNLIDLANYTLNHHLHAKLMRIVPSFYTFDVWVNFMDSFTRSINYFICLQPIVSNNRSIRISFQNVLNNYLELSKRMLDLCYLSEADKSNKVHICSIISKRKTANLIDFIFLSFLNIIRDIDAEIESDLPSDIFAGGDECAIGCSNIMSYITRYLFAPLFEYNIHKMLAIYHRNMIEESLKYVVENYLAIFYTTSLTNISHSSMYIYRTMWRMYEYISGNVLSSPGMYVVNHPAPSKELQNLIGVRKPSQIKKILNSNQTMLLTSGGCYDFERITRRLNNINQIEICRTQSIGISSSLSSLDADTFSRVVEYLDCESLNNLRIAYTFVPYTQFLCT